MRKEIICTVCPMGCHVTVDGEGEQIASVNGHTCKRGEQYATAEFAHPVRILTTAIKTDNPKIPVVAVRSEKPVPKEKMMDCMEVIRGCRVKAPVHTYDVLIENVCDTGINIISTSFVPKAYAEKK